MAQRIWTRHLGRGGRARAGGAALTALITCWSPITRAHEVATPVPKSAPHAEWPPGRAATHDIVMPVILVVGAEGAVSEVSLEASVDPAIDAATIAAAARWTFAPATRDGKPIRSKIRVLVRFKGVPAPKPEPPPAITPSPAPAPPTKALDVRVVGDAPPRSAGEVVRKSDVLKAAPHRTASDLLQVVPGVFITQHSGQGKAHQIFLRGFDAVHGQDIEIWVAGAPVNEVSNIHGQGYADLHFIMPEVVSRVRAKPGSYDPRQGDFAVAGSLGFDLGLSEPGLTTSLTLGSFGERRLFLAYHPKGAPDETFAAFESQRTDGFGPARAAQRTSAIGQAVFDLGSSARLRVMASTYSARFDSAGVLVQRDIESGRVDRFATYDPKQGGDSTRHQVVAAFGSESDADRSQWSIAPYFVARSLRLRSNFTGFLGDPTHGDSTQQRNDALTVGLTGHYRRSFRLFTDDDAALEGGISARNDWISQSQLRLAAVSDLTTKREVDASLRATDIAGYLDASLRLWGRVSLRGGVRLDGLSFSVEDRVDAAAGAARTALGAHLGGKATLDVATLPGLHLIASYGDGFRSPQARSLGDGERAPFAKVRSFEGGLRYGRGEQIQATAAVFHTRLDGDLVFDQATARNEPAPATVRTGLAVDLTLRPRSWITETLSVTYTRASFSASDAAYAAGDLVPYVPQLVIRSDASLRPTLARFWGRDLVGRAGVGLTFLAVRPLPYAEMGREVFLADATLGLRFKEIEFSTDLYNLLDAPWYDGQFTYASSFTRGAAPSLIPLRHVTAGAPRTFMATLSLHL